MRYGKLNSENTAKQEKTKRAALQVYWEISWRTKQESFLIKLEENTVNSRKNWFNEL